MQDSETDKSNTLLLPAQPKPPGWIRRRTLLGLLLAFAAVTGAVVFLVVRASQPREAPEAGRILQSQSSLPFQVLIPAYLPGGFQREKVEIRTDQRGPQGEQLVQLVYSTRGGDRLVLSEWLPQNGPMDGMAGMDGMEMPPAGSVHGVHACRCACQSNTLCTANSFMIDVGPLRVMAEMSNLQLLSFDQLSAILSTLGPASGLQTTTRLNEVPLSDTLPPAVEAPINASGIQEVVLIVTANGYSPAHFSVIQGIPVRLVFRQLGYVGCGNELLFHSGPGHEARLVLSGPDDQQALEFTPQQAGDFPFSCPHEIYQGVMTVLES